MKGSCDRERSCWLLYSFQVGWGRAIVGVGDGLLKQSLPFWKCVNKINIYIYTVLQMTQWTVVRWGVPSDIIREVQLHLST